MDRPKAETSQPECVRYRLTVLQRVLSVLPAAVVPMAFQIVIWLDGGPSGPVLVTGLLMGVCLPLAAVILPRHLGITLRPAAAVVHNLRRRTIPWSDVQAIHIESFLWDRTVVIHEANGRRTRLRAPMTGFLNLDRRFEEKFHTIGRWWLDHRGPDWTPVLSPGAQRGEPPASGRNPYAPPA